MELKIEAGFCILAGLAVFLVPLNWLGALFLAAAVHEFCHWAAITLCGGRVYSLRLGVGGAVMETTPLSRPQELVCALAGPMGGLLLAACYRWLPRTALCGLIQSLFNLLPLWPLDGGRALACFTGRIPVWTGRFVLMILAVILFGGGFSLGTVIFLALLALRLGKRPCKPAQIRVQ